MEGFGEQRFDAGSVEPTADGAQDDSALHDGMGPLGKTDDCARKRRRRIAAVVVLAVLILLALFALRMCSGSAGRDPNAMLGQLNGKTAEQIQAELDRTVEEGMFNISISSRVEFSDGSSEGELRIENVPGNRYLMQVRIKRDDTGETVYATGIVEPNHHIQRARLDVDLDQGTYPCTAEFTALDPGTEEPVGKAAARVEIVVES